MPLRTCATVPLPRHRQCAACRPLALLTPTWTPCTQIYYRACLPLRHHRPAPHCVCIPVSCSCLSPQRAGPDGVADMLWRGLNSYNFCPLLSKDVPRHARWETCTTCKKKFMMGVQGGSMGVNGQTCLPCSTAAFGGPGSLPMMMQGGGGTSMGGLGGISMMTQGGGGAQGLPTFSLDHATFGGL